MNIRIRNAQKTDYHTIDSLIDVSVRELAAPDYSLMQIEAALKTAFGLDTQLIKDQTYFMVESGHRPVACGSRSFRKTLFGSDSEQNRSPQLINVVE